MYFIRPSVPVRLGQDIRNVEVFVRDGDAMVKAKTSLFAGMWILVDPEEWDDDAKEDHMNLERID